MKRARLLLLCLGVLGAPAGLGAQTLEDYDYENLAVHGVGLDWGYIWPNKLLPTPAYTVRLDLGYLGPGVRIVADAGYWKSELKRSELEQWALQLRRLGTVVSADSLGPISWSDISLGADAQLVWTTPIKVLTYVGGGLGLHALNGNGKSIDDTFVEDLLDSITPAVALLAGLEFEPYPRFRVYGEGRLVLMTDLVYPGVRIGGQVMLPQARAGLERSRRGAQ